MAGVLRNLKPTMEPTGRVIRVRELVGGDPRQSRLVEVRLGCPEDRADFHVGYCRARLHGRFDQCDRRPKRGFVVCGVHGGGHAVRQRDGIRLSPQQASHLSGLARQIKRDGKVDLTVIPSFFPWLRERVAALKKNPELLYLQDDAATLTALRDLLLSGTVEMDVTDLTRLLAVLAQVKVNTIRAMAIEGRTVVPIAEVQRTIGIFIELFKRFVPLERQADLLRDMRLMVGLDEQNDLNNNTAGTCSPARRSQRSRRRSSTWSGNSNAAR